MPPAIFRRGPSQGSIAQPNHAGPTASTELRYDPRAEGAFEEAAEATLPPVVVDRVIHERREHQASGDSVALEYNLRRAGVCRASCPDLTEGVA